MLINESSVTDLQFHYPVCNLSLWYDHDVVFDYHCHHCFGATMSISPLSGLIHFNPCMSMSWLQFLSGIALFGKAQSTTQYHWLVWFIDHIHHSYCQLTKTKSS